MERLFKRAELLLLIIDYLSQFERSKLTRVSQSWRDVFTYYLYRNIFLPLSHLYSDKPWEVLKATGAAFDRNAHLVESLVTSSRGDITENDSVSATNWFRGRKPFANLQAFELPVHLPYLLRKAILDLLPQTIALRCLSVRIQDWQKWDRPVDSLRRLSLLIPQSVQTIALPRFSSATLTELELYPLFPKLDIPLSFFAELPKLKKLKITHAAFVQELNRDEDVLPALVWLELRYPRSLGYIPLFCNKLEVLILSPCSEDQLDELLSKTQSLRSLEVVMNRPTRWSESLPAMLLLHAPRLRNLSIDNTSPLQKHPKWGPSPSTPWKFLALQLSELETLRIRCPFMNETQPHMVDCSSTASGSFTLSDLEAAKPPSLRRLVFCGSKRPSLFLPALQSLLRVLLSEDLRRCAGSRKSRVSSHRLREVWVGDTRYGVTLVGGMHKSSADPVVLRLMKEAQPLQGRLVLVEHTGFYDMTRRSELGWAFRL